MKKVLIDLHTHSTASDGLDSPSQLVQRAFSSGVRTLALTDHDTLQGLEEASLQADILGVFFLYGVEIDINIHCGTLHLLGLNLDPSRGLALQDLEEALLDQRRLREIRNQEIISKLKSIGFDCDYEKIKNLANGTVGRVHIARYLFHMGLVKNQQVAFNKFLAEGKPAFVRKQSFDLEDAVGLIHHAGGKAIVAHPLSLHQSWGNLEEEFKRFKSLGVDGIEVYHSSCTRAQSYRLEQMAKKLSLLITGGSDYHGMMSDHSSVYLGCATKGEKIDINVLDPLLREDQLLFWHKMKRCFIDE